MTAIRRLRVDEVEKICDIDLVSGCVRAGDEEADASPSITSASEAGIRALLRALARGIA